MSIRLSKTCHQVRVFRSSLNFGIAFLVLCSLLIIDGCGSGGAQESRQPPSFRISSSPSALTLQQGASGSVTLNVAAINGFSGSVSLAVSDLPAGVTASFNPVSTNSTSTMTLTISGSASTGTATTTV